MQTTYWDCLGFLGIKKMSEWIFIIVGWMFSLTAKTHVQYMQTPCKSEFCIRCPLYEVFFFSELKLNKSTLHITIGF